MNLNLNPNSLVNMQRSQKTTKTQYLKKFILLISASFCATYVLVSTQKIDTSKLLLDLHHYSSSSQDHVSDKPTTLDDVVFGIASSGPSWPERKEYTKLWWNKPNNNSTMRGCVFVDTLPVEDPHNANNDTSSSPPLCVSEDTSRFSYTYRNGFQSAIRMARVVKETVELNHSDVRWYVFGDDDTVFFTENLMKTLSKYDHRLWYYIGSNSESYRQNRFLGFGMAFGGAGFAISSPLAKVLAKFFDYCIERYPHLHGSDSRVYSCIIELGVALTHEPGFHQVDVTGNIFGLLAAHPVTPLVSLHHPGYTDPIFPNMTPIKAFQHLFEAVDVDSQRILQQTVCYEKRFSWTISVSWGYAVQVFQNNMLLRDVLSVEKTFRDWAKGNILSTYYSFNTREVHPDPCRRATIFYLENLSSGKDGIIISNYRKYFRNCSYNVKSPRRLEMIKVVSNKLELDIKQLQSPRRHCCDVLNSSTHDIMEIGIRECKDDEFIYMH